MNKKLVERYEHLSGSLRTTVGIWFFVGMPLSMVLSGLYFVVGIPPPPLLFFLASVTYLSGGLLGILWSGESLRRKALSRTELMGVLFVLSISTGFLLIGIAFAVIAFRRV